MSAFDPLQTFDPKAAYLRSVFIGFPALRASLLIVHRQATGSRRTGVTLSSSLRQGLENNAQHSSFDVRATRGAARCF